jgi:Ca2+-binding EF-hand superfamily protein
MASFGKYRMPTALATAFTPAETDELRTNFGKFDNNGDGFIDGVELATILGLVGESATPTEIDKLLKEADTDGDGKISFDEYVHMIHKNKQV